MNHLTKTVNLRCKNCGHEICELCQNWCDTIGWSDADIKVKGINQVDEDLNDDDRFPVLCCDGGCEV